MVIIVINDRCDFDCVTQTHNITLQVFCVQPWAKGNVSINSQYKLNIVGSNNVTKKQWF